MTRKQRPVIRAHTFAGSSGGVDCGELPAPGPAGYLGPCHSPHLGAAGPDVVSGRRTTVVGLLGCVVRIPSPLGNAALCPIHLLVELTSWHWAKASLGGPVGGQLPFWETRPQNSFPIR